MLVSTLLTFGLASPASAVIPTVTSVTPTGGPLEGGVAVLIKGKEFTGTSAVTIGGVAATNFAVVNDTTLVATVPATSTAGNAAIVVTNATGPNTTGASFRYAAPTVTKVEPATASPDEAAIVTITGTGFTGVTAAEVLFGSHAASSIWLVSDTTIIATSPITTADPAVTVNPGIVDVTVSSNSVASATTAATKFLFSPGLPTITQLGSGAPITGTDGAAIGSTLTIVGTNLWGTTKVKFGSTVVTTGITVNGAGTEVQVSVPNRASGPVDVQVETAAGTSLTNLSTTFSYYSTTAPSITSIYPSVFDKTEETGGGTLLVTGKGFTGVGTDDVTVICADDLTPTSATVVADTSLILVIPGNTGDEAANCDLKIDNPLDATKTTTSVGIIRYV